MYIFEFTDKQIKIYNKKNNKLILEPIPPKIIVNNKIYDFVKLTLVLNKVVNKYKVINTLFRVKISVLVFQSISPSELYLIKNLLRGFSNILVDVIYVSNMFDNNYIFISGDEIYFNNKPLYRLKRESYILVGNTENFDIIKDNLERKYKIKLLSFENSNTLIYEKV